ncbi:unnamed protein product [Ixodes persulcatus]
MPHRGDLACRAVIYGCLFRPIQARCSERGKQLSTRAVLMRSRCYENAREMQVGGVARVETPLSLVACRQTPKNDCRSGFIKIEEHKKIQNWNRALTRKIQTSWENIFVYCLTLRWLGTRPALNCL